ncbi:MAG: hypothetical protein ABIE84_06375 [bacterium]
MKELVVNDSKIIIIKGDITKQSTEAIVNGVKEFLVEDSTIGEVHFVLYNDETYEAYING